MTVSYKKTLNGTRVVIHANANTGSIVVPGNDTTSNLASFVGETVYSAGISKVIHGADGAGYWLLWRGANLVGSYSGSGVVPYDGAMLTIDSTANITANLVGTANGYIILEVKKNV